MRPILILLMLLLASGIRAQPVTNNGTIVNQAGDSLKGAISIPRSDKSPRYIDFTLDGSKTRYGPEQVRYFSLGVEGSYIGVITDVDKSPSTLKDFNDALIQEGSIRDTVFLSVVVHGKMNLYKLVDERDVIHYFVGEDGKLTELILRVRRKQHAGGYQLATFEVYKDQLKTMITNCSRAEPWIDKTEYTQSSLSNLIANYNSCHEETPSYVQKQSGPRLVVSVFGGLVSSSLNNMTSEPRSGAAASSYTGSSRGVAGLLFEILTSKSQKRFSVVNEVLTFGVDFAAKKNGAAANYFFEFDYLRYNLGGRFYFTGRKLKPYVQVGVGIGRAYRSSYFSGLPVNQSFVPSKSDRGLHVGVGLKYKRIGIQGRYERSSGFSETSQFIPRVNHLAVMLMIDLNIPKE